MPRFVLLTLGLLVLAAALAPAPAAAQLANTYELSVLAGLGGSIDNDEAGLSNPAFQLGFAVTVEDHIDVGLRVGTIGYGSDDRLGRLADPSFEYITIAGKYDFPDFYSSGLFIGIGYYQVDGSRFVFGDDFVELVPESSSSIGLTGGVTGEWNLNPRVALLVEATAHLIPGESAELFATGLVGLQFGF